MAAAGGAVTVTPGLPADLLSRIANALGMTPEALVPLLERLREAGLEVVPQSRNTRGSSGCGGNTTSMNPSTQGLTHDRRSPLGRLGGG